VSDTERRPKKDTHRDAAREQQAVLRTQSFIAVNVIGPLQGAGSNKNTSSGCHGALTAFLLVGSDISDRTHSSGASEFSPDAAQVIALLHGIEPGAIQRFLAYLIKRWEAA
jgi:hypothetical protein